MSPNSAHSCRTEVAAPLRVRVAVAAVALFLLSVTAVAAADATKYVNLATIDGTRQITSEDYINGISDDSGANVITPCAQFDSYQSNFVLRVTMGAFSDYFMPSWDGKTVCDVLTATSLSGTYRYSASDPTNDDWNGYSDMIGLATQWPDALGGAPFNYLETTTPSEAKTRSTIAFWGFNGNGSIADTGAQKGGCCSHVAYETPSWLQAFRIDIAPMDGNRLYLTWLTQPTAIVKNAPIIFMVKVWNFRGDVYSDRLDFVVNLDGKKTVTEKSHRRATLVFEEDLSADASFASLDVDKTFTLTVSTTVAGLPPAHSTLSLDLVVLPPLESISATLKPCTLDGGIPEMLHFGPTNFALGPVSQFSAFDDDWFAAASLATSGAAGEAYLRPLEGHTGIAEGDPSLGATTQTWVAVSSDPTAGKGTMVSRIPVSSVPATPEANGTLQFYAFTLYSASDQMVVVQVATCEGVAFFIDHAEVEPPSDSIKYFTPYADGEMSATQRSSFSYFLSRGYHQVLVKLYSSKLQDPSTIYTSLEFKVFGTGIAYALERPTEIPDNSYQLTNGDYMYYLLASGNTKDTMLYTTTINDDLVNVATLIPKAGQPVITAASNDADSVNAKQTWNTFVFYGGNIPVDGSDVPAGMEFAVKYVTIALYNQYDTDIAVNWKLIVRGSTQLYLDGVSQYSAGEGTTEQVVVPTVLMPGWHQVVIRLAARRGNTWIFRSYIHFDSVRLIGSQEVQQSTSLPFGLRKIDSGVPLQAMLELTTKSEAVDSAKVAAMLTYNSNNETMSDVTFLSEGLSLTMNAPGVGREHRSFFAYETENITLTRVGDDKQVGQFEWVPTTKLQDGIWGSVTVDRLAGGYYRLWAFSLYAAEAGVVAANVEFVGGVAVWVDGVLAASVQPAPETVGYSQQRTMSLDLTAGWHQVVVKLQVPSTFHLVSTATESGSLGYSAWADGPSACRAKLGAGFATCMYDAYCPFNSPRVGVGLPLPASTSSATPLIYAPVANAADTYVQLAQGSSDANTCSERSIDTTLASYGAGNYVGCCQAVRAPSLTVTFAVPQAMAGKLGYSYHELVTIAAPTISVNRLYVSSPMVTISSATQDVTLRYRLGNAGNWLSYTGPFEVSGSVNIQAQAFLGNRPSPTSSLIVEAPTAISFDRTSCLYDQPCALTFTGANVGDSASLVSSMLESKPLQGYANITFASKQERSTDFSGVSALDVSTLTANLVVPSPSSASTAAASTDYVVMVYNTVNGTQEGFVSMTSNIKLSPTDVIATVDTVFQVDNYLVPSDTVLFPQLYTRSPNRLSRAATDFYAGGSSCTVDECEAAMNQYGASAGVAVSQGRTLSANLATRTGSYALTCMCVCTGCHSRLPSGEMGSEFVMASGSVAALPVSITVHGSGTPTTDHRDKVSGMTLAFVILVPIIIVVFVAVVGVLVYMLLRNRQQQSAKFHGIDARDGGEAGHRGSLGSGDVTTDSVPFRESSNSNLDISRAYSPTSFGTQGKVSFNSSSEPSAV